jgi:peroxiredoxin
MPELQAYYQAHENQGFIIIAIESGEPVGTVAKFKQQLGLTFPVWLDPKGLALEAFQNWDLPSSYVLDRQGKLRMDWSGPINQETLEQYVTPLLDAVQE